MLFNVLSVNFHLFLCITIVTMKYYLIHLYSIYISPMFVGGLMFYLRFSLCLFVDSDVRHILCCVLFFYVFCTMCCQFLWDVNCWLLLRYSLTFMYMLLHLNSVYSFQKSLSLLCILSLLFYELPFCRLRLVLFVNIW